MKCPKCGTEMQTVQTITRSAFMLRVRQCSSKTCATKFVTEEVPGDPRVYHRLMAEDTSRRRKAATPPRKRARRLRRAG